MVGLLEQHHLVMDPVLRKNLAECVIMMRNRNMLPAVGVNQLFFQVFLLSFDLSSSPFDPSPKG